jgi:uncharacterized protein YcgI (DUF1989 family)
MKIIQQAHLAPNTGWSGEMQAGQVLRIGAETIVDFVCFNLDNVAERFDQARTKVYNMKIWISAGDKLFSKLNNPMMTLLTDPFQGTGTHDLQEGMCSGVRYALAKKEGRLDQYHHGGRIEVPDHGCWENLQGVLCEKYRIAREDIPSPLNLFQNMNINTATGEMQHTPVRPAATMAVELRAEMSLVVAASACPDLAAPGGAGKAVDVVIYQP